MKSECCCSCWGLAPRVWEWKTEKRQRALYWFLGGLGLVRGGFWFWALVGCRCTYGGGETSLWILTFWVSSPSQRPIFLGCCCCFQWCWEAVLWWTSLEWLLVRPPHFPSIPPDIRVWMLAGGTLLLLSRIGWITSLSPFFVKKTAFTSLDSTWKLQAGCRVWKRSIFSVLAASWLTCFSKYPERLLLALLRVALSVQCQCWRNR